jgi:acetolactate synthase-1/2/3 large subunit
MAKKTKPKSAAAKQGASRPGAGAAATGNLAEMSAAEVTVKTLAVNGIDKLYCLPGVQNDDFFDALVRTTPEIAPVHTRHEQATAYMAMGAAMASGKPQAYAVVPGPGFLNTTTALATAFTQYVPILAISGQVPDRMIGKGFGQLHEIPDQLAIMRQLTKWADRILTPEDAVSTTREAFRQLKSGAPRPVGFDCPWNCWRKKGPVAFDPTPVARETPAIDDDAIEKAAKLLGKAKRPLIVVGSGAQDASAEVRRVAEMLQAPVAMFRNGQGVLDRRHPLAQGMVGAHRLWQTADVVLGVGTRLQTQQMSWGTDDDLAIVHMDIDPAAIGHIQKPTIGIVADAAEGLTKLAERLERHNKKRASRAEEMAELGAKVAETLSGLAPQQAYIDAIRAALPEDGIVVEELTQISYVSRVTWPTYRPRTYLSTGFQGTLGWGYPTALGAKAAMPDRKVVSINGDGGFLFGMQEMATAMRHRLGVVAVVFNDNAYGNVRRIQQDQYEGRVVASDLVNPDFVALASAFGMRGLKAEGPADLGRKLAHCFRDDEPTLIEVPVGKFPDPWKFLQLPRVRGSKA